jgi:ABC-2 type transport system ATP-binding protein
VPTIEINNLTKKFGKLKALNKVDLEVQAGEVFGFIGPNGAGKTTTIRTILGILKATEGSVKVFGRDAWEDSVELHKKMAYVPGDVNLWSNLTGGEVIDLFVQLRGKYNRKRREELIQKFQLDPTKKCGTYSKGNRQKVALVAALASDVDLYILDEPTSGLDPLMGQVFRKEITRLKDADKTIFLSSHILQEVELLCDRVAIIKEGKIVKVGVMSEMKKLAQKEQSLEDIFIKQYEKDLEEA